jgi:hypothetical protein
MGLHALIRIYVRDKRAVTSVHLHINLTKYSSNILFRSYIGIVSNQSCIYRRTSLNGTDSRLLLNPGFSQFIPKDLLQYSEYTGVSPKAGRTRQLREYSYSGLAPVLDKTSISVLLVGSTEYSIKCSSPVFQECFIGFSCIFTIRSCCEK